MTLSASLLLAANLLAGGAELHVAPGGDDAAPGTRRQPFATLAHARDALRVAGGGTVYLADGVYPMKATLTLDDHDSGSTWCPEPGAAPRLSGGLTIPPSAWQPVTDAAILARLPQESREKVRVVDLRALGIDSLPPIRSWGMGQAAPMSELFVDGRAATLARYPKSGWLKISRVLDRGSIWGSIVGGEPELHEKPDRGAVFELLDPHLARWTSAPDAWLFGYWWWDWADQAVPVAAIDPAAQTIKTALPHSYGFRAGARYYVFNLLEELSAPGEWYADHAAMRLYLYPPGPLDKSKVELSLFDRPMLAMKNAERVTVRGLTFETSRGGAITIDGGSECQVLGCTMRALAAHAVTVNGGRDHLVAGCDIHDVNGGISLAGGDRRTLTRGGHVAENNHIYNYSRINKTYVAAVSLQGVGLRAAHNRIHFGPHLAVSFGGNDNVIELNEIYDVCRDSSDVGVIYTGRDWSMRGNVIRSNFIHDIVGLGDGGAEGIYLDDCFSSADVIGNVLYRMNGLSFLIGGGRDNVITNNVTVHCGPLSLDDRGLNWAKASTAKNGDMAASLKRMPYREEPWRTRYPKLVGLLDDDQPGAPKGNTVARNVFAWTPEPRLAKAARQFGTVQDNWVCADDPGFVDLARLDLRLRPDAPVFTKIPGFQAIPFDQMGLIVDAHRSALPPSAPSAMPGGQAFARELSVTLTSRTAGAEIHYTLDGATPTLDAPRCDGPLTIKASGTLRAAAFVTLGGARLASEATEETFTCYPLGPGGGLPVSLLPILESDGYVEPKRDVNMAGGPIKLRGTVYPRGLLLHPKERPGGNLGYAVFALDGGLRQATHFRASAGVEDSVGTRGTVVFRVEVRRGGQWIKVYESDVRRGGQPLVDIDADVSGADQLRLTVTDGGININAAHAAWGDARLE